MGGSLRLRSLVVGFALLMVTGCATNGELEFAGHPLDCAMGVGHSDCAPGTPGAARYARQGSTATQDSLAILSAAPAYYSAPQLQRLPVTCTSHRFDNTTQTTCN